MSADDRDARPDSRQAAGNAAEAAKVLIWSRIPSAGFQHSSIPLAAKMIEEMGKKTGAWTSTTSWDVADITAENLKQYDAIFLSNTTGTFLDDPNDQAVTDTRRKAFQDFLMSGKGVAGIHATGDSYHGRGRAGAGRAAGSAWCAGRWPGGPPATPAGARPRPVLGFRGAEAGASGRAAVALVGRGDRRLLQVPLELPDADHREDRRSEEPDYRGVQGQVVQHDRRGLHVQRELVLARARARPHEHRLRHDDDCDKGIEAYPRKDHDFALSWIQKVGQGRVLYQALGHHESIYYNNPDMLAHILAGMQYAIGDLKADDTPSKKK